MAQQLGWLDTNIFVHVLFRRDSQYERSQEIVAGLVNGTVEGWLDPLVVHELTYTLRRFPQFTSRDLIERYIRRIVVLEHVRAEDKSLLLDALARWATEGSGFVDSWLAVRAKGRDLPVCSANRRDFPDVSNTF